ncbi:hypothetical protein DFP73DRAFT_554207 [Morchella snyderi]|nr:hypothetical protein DFP73DRAFT_554207 [Morchella snyderi]
MSFLFFSFFFRFFLVVAFGDREIKRGWPSSHHWEQIFFPPPPPSPYPRSNTAYYRVGSSNIECRVGGLSTEVMHR